MKILFNNEKEFTKFKNAINNNCIKSIKFLDGVKLASYDRVRKIDINTNDGSIFSFNVSVGAYKNTLKGE